jgi:GntR family transcriptional repressor for pyruvate dehydrogenase complex
MSSVTGRATDQAIAKLKELISSGEFSAGARLPTERELTQRFGISRSSLREAVRALALVGVLEPRVGDGTYVTTLEPDLLLTGIGFVSDLANAESLLEIHQVRRILEPEATRLAAHRLTEADFERLRECLRSMETADSTPAFIEADAQFHRVILDKCGNATLASLIQNLSSDTLRARLWQSLVARGAVEATLASHWSIYNALVSRDADMAAAADVMHLGIAEEWLRTLGQQSRGASGAGPTRPPNRAAAS